MWQTSNIRRFSQINTEEFQHAIRKFPSVIRKSLPTITTFEKYCTLNTSHNKASRRNQSYRIGMIKTEIIQREHNWIPRKSKVLTDKPLEFIFEFVEKENFPGFLSALAKSPSHLSLFPYHDNWIYNHLSN